MTDEAEKKRLTCPSCGTGLVNMVTGAVCPAGCGGLYPRLTVEENVTNSRLARVSALPVALKLVSVRAVNGEDSAFVSAALYRVGDRAGVWRRVPLGKATLVRPPDNGDLLARWQDDHLMRLRRFTVAEAEFLVAMPYREEVKDAPKEE